jgi:hypothetical protein
VSLETENGQNAFRGQQADQIVYQTRLKNFEDNATAEQINERSKSQTNLSQLKSKLNDSTKRKDKSVEKLKENESRRTATVTLLMETFDLEFSHWVKFNLKTNETIKGRYSQPH